MTARLTFLIVTVLAVVATATRSTRATAIPNDTPAVTHALNRLAFGPRPGDVEAVQRQGLARWIEQQLRRSARTEVATPAFGGRGVGRNIMNIDRREVFGELSDAKVKRAVTSDRQLEEVLTDFWFNHFNVFAGKGPIALYLADYERDAIRPHVLGSFRELLGATAKSPAMLFYLDNWQSKKDGINENYARELMELHTLGVDGGYTQNDVTEVARAFTGWTIMQPRMGGAFRFARRLHDDGEKRVLGQVIRAGGGMDDGERVLDIVAAHPSTARHIAFKLAQRFVSDTPPPGLVDRAAARFRETKGDLREVVRTIITSPEFFAPAARNAKVKTPFEFVVSALRATGAEVSSALPVARALAAMGMPLYLCQPPTGYGETADAWISSGSLVNRINFAVELNDNRVRGVRLPDSRLARVDVGAPEFQRQ